MILQFDIQWAQIRAAGLINADSIKKLSVGLAVCDEFFFLTSI